MLAGTDEHIWGGYDVCNRVVLWVVSGDPDRDRNVVCRLPIGDGESSMETEQQLGSSVVVSYGEEDEARFWRRREMGRTVDIGPWTDWGKSSEESVCVGVDCV